MIDRRHVALRDQPLEVHGRRADAIHRRPAPSHPIDERLFEVDREDARSARHALDDRARERSRARAQFHDVHGRSVGKLRHHPARHRPRTGRDRADRCLGLRRNRLTISTCSRRPLPFDTSDMRLLPATSARRWDASALEQALGGAGRAVEDVICTPLTRPRSQSARFERERQRFGALVRRAAQPIEDRVRNLDAHDLAGDGTPRAAARRSPRARPPPAVRWRSSRSSTASKRLDVENRRRHEELGAGLDLVHQPAPLGVRNPARTD